MDELLTLKQAAERLGYSESGLRKLVRQGAIRFSKPAGRLRFRPEWLDEFVECGEPAAQRKHRERSAAPKPRKIDWNFN